MEVKDSGRDIFASMTLLRQQVDSLKEEQESLKEELDLLRISEVIKDCMECFHRVVQVLNRKLMKKLGEALQNIEEVEKEFLLAGPFAMHKNKKQLCGTYFDLLQYYYKIPSEKVDGYLRSVESMVVLILSRSDCHLQQTSDVRIMFKNFLMNGKALQNVRSHIGMVKDREMRELLLRRIEQYGKDTLEKFGFVELFPVILAGVFVLRNGEIESDSNDEMRKHDLVPKGVIQRVRVTFLVKRKLPLLHVVGLFGNIRRLGNNDPEKALVMACKDGLLWEKVVEMPRDIQLVYSYVVLKKNIGQKKWTVVEGPMNTFAVNVGASSTMLLETEWPSTALP